MGKCILFIYFALMVLDNNRHSKEEAVLYSEYVPRVPADTFVPHPANVVEAHTLASVALPDCDYQPTLPGISLH